tara:strand:- start:84 stop:362 length:279 start_codon:yes stop_codon:yes gene_type:complete
MLSYNPLEVDVLRLEIGSLHHAKIIQIIQSQIISCSVDLSIDSEGSCPCRLLRSSIPPKFTGLENELFFGFKVAASNVIIAGMMNYGPSKVE